MKKKVMISVWMGVAVLSFGEGAGAPVRGPRAGWSPFLQGGSVYRFDSGLESGGEMGVNRYYIEGGLAYLFRADRMVSLSAGYGQDDYHFSGNSAAPWNNIDAYKLGAFVRWGLDSDWTLLVAPSVRAYAETDAQHSTAWSGGLFLGASYKVNDSLTVGPGLGVVGQIEDDARVFPILLIDWAITERWSLSTGGGLAATQGPGLTLAYHASKKWRWGLTGRYEQKRFRLEDGGVGEEQSVALLGTVTYSFNPAMQLGLLCGVDVAGEIRRENAEGREVWAWTYDSAPVVGGVFSVRF